MLVGVPLPSCRLIRPLPLTAAQGAPQLEVTVATNFMLAALLARGGGPGSVQRTLARQRRRKATPGQPSQPKGKCPGTHLECHPGPPHLARGACAAVNSWQRLPKVNATRRALQFCCPGRHLRHLTNPNPLLGKAFALFCSYRKAPSRRSCPRLKSSCRRPPSSSSTPRSRAEIGSPGCPHSPGTARKLQKG